MTNYYHNYDIIDEFWCWMMMHLKVNDNKKYNGMGYMACKGYVPCQVWLSWWKNKSIIWRLRYHDKKIIWWWDVYDHEDFFWPDNDISAGASLHWEPCWNMLIRITITIKMINEIIILFQPAHLSPENLAERLEEAMPCHNYQVHLLGISFSNFHLICLWS